MVAAQAVTRRLRFLSSEQVIALHDAMLAETGGLSRSGHRGSSHEGVDAAVQAVKNSYYDTARNSPLPPRPTSFRDTCSPMATSESGAAAMLTFLEVNGGRAALTDERCATLMIELQRRAEAGEDVVRLFRWIAGELPARRGVRRRRRS